MPTVDNLMSNVYRDLGREFVESGEPWPLRSVYLMSKVYYGAVENLMTEVCLG